MPAPPTCWCRSRRRKTWSRAVRRMSRPLPPGWCARTSASPAPLPSSDEAAAAVGWWQALLLALLGGLALNLMPCVFPVLSLKVLGLAEAVHRAEQRRHGIAYAAGAILSFTLLGAVLLTLRT